MRNLPILVSFIFVSNAFLSHLNATVGEQNNPRKHDFSGVVSSSNCTGTLVRFETSRDSDPVVILTAGHCTTYYESGKIVSPGGFLTVKDDSLVNHMTWDLLSSDGKTLEELNDFGLTVPVALTGNVVYVTVTGTDISLFKLTMTYEEIFQKHGISPRILSKEKPSPQEKIDILSGQLAYSCKVDDLVFRLREEGHTFSDSIRYSKDGCDTQNGTSGAPIISRQSGKIVGVHGTKNKLGHSCTRGNPCEVDKNGKISVRLGQTYGQQTHLIYTCLDSRNELDLALPGCQLTK
jgi:hypothetical protein